MATHHISRAALLVVGVSLSAAPALAETGEGNAGVSGMIAAPVVPQYLVADATLFLGNAANTAGVLSVEQDINVQAPAVFQDQAAFLLAATNRALSSLVQLEQNAERTQPSAVPAIRAAIGQIVAAQATAAQASQAVNEGPLGSVFTANIRAARAHLQAAARDMQDVGRAYGAPQFATAGVCTAPRGAAFVPSAGARGPRGGAAGVPGGSGGTQERPAQHPCPR